MALQEEAAEQGANTEDLPGMATHDPLTYDPTQGPGSDMWQLSVRASMQRNANERRN